MDIQASRREYDAHNLKIWRLDYFDELTGGYLVTNLLRIERSLVSKNERLKFEKEFAMSLVFARNGYRVEMLAEFPGISSPDVLINGIPGDLKRLSSHNNLTRHAKEAIFKQGAKLVLIEFALVTDRTLVELSRLQEIGISGYYFATGVENTIHSF